MPSRFLTTLARGVLSLPQDPPAHAKQKEADGAYKHRKDFLKILKWKPDKFSVASG